MCNYCPVQPVTNKNQKEEAMTMLLTTQAELETFAQDFDFLFCRRKTALSFAIRLFTKGKWSHVGHIRKGADGKFYIVDAQKDGYEPKTLTYWLEKYKYEFKAMRDPNISYNIEKYKQNEKEMLGIDYDFFGMARHAYKNIAELLNNFRARKLPTWIDLSDRFEDKRLYCSEGELRIVGYSPSQSQKDPDTALTMMSDAGFYSPYEYKPN